MIAKALACWAAPPVEKEASPLSREENDEMTLFLIVYIYIVYYTVKYCGHQQYIMHYSYYY